jgi:hypothetical protein
LSVVIDRSRCIECGAANPLLLDQAYMRTLEV